MAARRRGFARSRMALMSCLLFYQLQVLVGGAVPPSPQVNAHMHRRANQIDGFHGVDSHDSVETPRALAWLFMEAQAARQRQNHTRASALYDELIQRTHANATASSTETRQLRLWAQYQHADLLLRFTASNNIEILQQARHKFQEAIELSEWAPTADTLPVFGVAERVHAFNSMGLLARALGEPTEAVACFQRAIDITTSAPEPYGNMAVVYLELGMGMIFYRRGDEAQAQSWWERALTIDPLATDAMASLATVHGSRGDATQAQRLLTCAIDVAPHGTHQLQSLRLQLAMSRLKMIYESANDVAQARSNFERALTQLQREPGRFPELLGTIDSGSMGYYAIYQGYNDKRVRQQLAQIYADGARHDLAFVAPHVALQPRHHSHGHHRIRVGFLSAFLYHHSVGLLLAGVIRELARTGHFDIFVLTFDTARHDHVTQRLQDAQHDRASALHWLVLPERDLPRAQRLVAALELDVLVFTEIGMHAATYFLAFARLARRTVQFWGHAVTSGIPTVDYFVSSTLFRRDVATNPAEHYAECLYEMDGLTTLFPRPPAAQTGLRRASLGLPHVTAMPHMVLVPQTLYKLHPDFDRIIQRVLSRVPTSFLVLPIGDTPLLVEQLTRRWRHGGVVDAGVYKRIFFVRALNETEFLALCEIAALVLDPFPVGGGRSSFEVFSVGTPILGLMSRTTILQLTLGMYRRMGIDPTCCFFESEDALVDHAVYLLRDERARGDLKSEIQQQSHKLYEASNARVVREWQHFFEQILSRPSPTVNTWARDHITAQKRCPLWTPPARALPSRVVYESLVVLSNTPSSSLSSRIVRLHDHDDPFELATAWFPDDSLQAAFLGKVLWNAQQRFRQRVVDAFVVHSTASGVAYHMEIREGDDLHQTVRWQLEQALVHSTLDTIDTVASLFPHVLHVARQRVPQHTTAAWREARALVPSRRFDHIASTSSRPNDCVALVVTTCKRLSLFLRTMRSLAHVLRISRPVQWADHFCGGVLVVDDNSSADDRAAMRTAFPSVSFVWKTPSQSGHAVSLNLALRRLVDVRFVLYLEDEWEFRRSDNDSNGDLIRDAVGHGVACCSPRTSCKCC